MSKPASICSECNAPLPANVLGGLCPRCLGGALNMSRILQGSFTAKTQAAPQTALADEAQALTATTSYLQPGEHVGVGGMGEVCTAHDLKLTRMVAVKRLRPEREGQPGAVARFLAEARIAATLEHPGIVPIHDVGIDPQGRPFYTMRLVRGESLGAVLERLAHGDAETIERYPLATLLGIFQQVCDAVAYAHSRGVIHRDLKPDNIMLGEFGQVVVMDWGLAKVLEESGDPQGAVGLPPSQSVTDSTGDPPVSSGDSPDETEKPTDSGGNADSPTGLAHVAVGPDTSGTGAGESPAPPTPTGLTQENVVLGSLGYMAPEQAGGRAWAADARADIYALGAILYHLLTLRPPIRALRDMQLALDRTTGGDIRPPTDFNPGGPSEVQRTALLHCPARRIPSALSAVAMKALATRPEDRYPKVEALRLDVGNWLNGFPVSAEGAGLVTHLSKWARRHRAIVAAVLLLVLLALGFSWHNWRTLRRLNDTAPTFAELAESLAREQKLEDALRNVTFALRLTPEHSGYLALKGNLLLGLLRISEARDAFNAAKLHGASDARINSDLELCDRLLQRRAPDGAFPADALTELYRTFVLNNRPGEALAIFAHLREQRETLVAFWTERLDKAGLQGKLVQDPDGNLELTMTGGSVTNLAPLAGMPLSSLLLNGVNCLFTNLSPLRGMPLRTLSLLNTPISDLRPLAGMPLQEFHVQGAKNLADLSPLRGMKLRYLTLQATAVTDLAPLEGMPLQNVVLSPTKVSLDLSPITNAPIQALSLDNAPFTNLSQLAALQLDYLNLNNTPVADLSALSRLRLTNLKLQGTRVVDLRPLEFMPLEHLDLVGAPIKDISVLRGKHLKILYLTRCAQLRDLSPLADCRDLEELSLPLNHGDIEFLRQLPRLKKLGYDWPAPPATDFWREYDARKAMKSRLNN